MTSPPGNSHHVHRDWQIEFDYPSGWQVQERAQGGEQTLAILTSNQAQHGSPTVILELTEEVFTDDLSSLVDGLVLNLSVEKNDFSLITKDVKRNKENLPRGIILFKYREGGAEFVSQKIVVPLSNRSYVTATASSELPQWVGSKGHFQSILSSVRKADLATSSMGGLEILFDDAEAQACPQTHNVLKSGSNAPDKLTAVQQLLQSDLNTRDIQWYEKLLSTLEDAALYAPSQPVVPGGDGFSYYSLYTRQLPQLPMIRQVNLKQVVSQVTEEGVGVVIDPGFPHAYAFGYGELWHFRQQEALTVYRPRISDMPRVNLGGELMGAPSEKVLPPFARRVLRSHLKYILKIKTPKVFYTCHMSAEGPSQMIMFNLFLEDFRDEDSYNRSMASINWFMPPYLTLAYLQKSDPSTKEFVEL